MKKTFKYKKENYQEDFVDNKEKESNVNLNAM